MTARKLRFAPVELAGQTFEALDLDHAGAADRIIEEMRSGVAVYYDTRWQLTGTFCEFLLEHPDLVRGRTVLVAGAGVGLEAVVIGRLAERVVINDMAPASLELAAEQLTRNGVTGFGVQHGGFQQCDLTGIDLVVACFVVYDEGTRDAMSELLERAAAQRIPTLLANEDVGGWFGQVMGACRAPVEDLVQLDRGRIVRVG